MLGPWIFGLSLLLLAGGLARAQVVLDGTAGAAGPLAGPDFQIGAELGTRAGPNLFHSFERFGLRTGESATFSGPDAIRHVVSRVTGGERSEIDGILRSTMPQADFWFLNPAGVLFGPNAALDVQGSFHVSTADELRFADGARFSARDPAASTFTTAAPEAFGFLGSPPGAITVDRSSLEVPDGRAFTLVGGDITILGRPNVPLFEPGSINLWASGGRITLAALESVGEFNLDSHAAVADKLANIHLKEQGIVDTSGENGGSIFVTSANLHLDNVSIIITSNFGDRDTSGGIRVVADEIVATNLSQIATLAEGGGRAGSMIVQGGSIYLADGSRISADTFDRGSAGSVIVSAVRGITLVNGGAIGSASRGGGSGGEVRVSAHEIRILAHAESTGLTGITTSSQVGSEGGAGNVKVTANVILLAAENGNAAISSSTRSDKDAGSVTVQASDLLLISGGICDNQGRGCAGVLSAVLCESAGICIANGSGGAVDVRGGSIRLEGGANISASVGTFGEGEGGSVTVRARDLSVFSGARIASDSLGEGPAGMVNIYVADRLMVDNASITTESLTGGGGAMDIEVRNLIDLRNSEITTSVAGGTDPTAGNISIDPTILIIDGSVIQANAPEGFGGNLTISADNILVPGGDFEALLARGDIDASGGDPERSGTIVVDAADADLSGGLVVLEGRFVDAGALLRPACVARRDVGASSLTGVGRGGLPPSPDAPLGAAITLRPAADCPAG